MSVVTVENTAIVESDPAISLPDAAVSEAAHLASEANSLFTDENTATNKRALIFRAHYLYVMKYGLDIIEAHAKRKGFKASETLSRQLVAQFLLGINIHEKPETRAERHTRVRPFAQVLDALLRRSDEHSDFDEAAWIEWYKAQGQQRGLINSLPKQPKGAKDAKVKPTAESVVEAAFGSPAAVTLSGSVGIPALVPGKAMLVMVRQEETGTVIVPLPKAGSQTLASVAGYQTCGLENAPAQLRYWHALMYAGTAIIPDGTSEEPVNPLAPDDEPNASTPMKPSYGIYLWDGSKFSIASARAYDTAVVEVVPRDGVEVGLSSGAMRFMDNRGRRKMQEWLIQPSLCAGYSGKGSIRIITQDDRVRVKFTHVDTARNGQLNFPPITEFRTNWTSRVSAEFAPQAEAVMDAEALSQFRNGSLALFRKKRKDEVVLVSVGEDSIGFKRDKAKTETHGATVVGAAEVRVMQSDLLAVVPQLLALDHRGDLTWKLDPEGLLCVELATAEAVIRAYIQTLESGRQTRSRKLLERVRSEATDTPAASVLAA